MLRAQGVVELLPKTYVLVKMVKKDLSDDFVFSLFKGLGYFLSTAVFLRLPRIQVVRMKAPPNTSFARLPVCNFVVFF